MLIYFLLTFSKKLYRIKVCSCEQQLAGFGAGFGAENGKL